MWRNQMKSRVAFTRVKDGMMTFKPGDKVICVDGSGKKDIIKGKTYEVLRCPTAQYVSLRGIAENPAYFKSRFRLATEEEVEGKKEKTMTFKPGDKVVCVDIQGTDLKKDMVYTVDSIGGPIRTDETYLRLKDCGDASGWYSDRFCLATEEEIRQANPHLGSTVDSFLKEGGIQEEVEAEEEMDWEFNHALDTETREEEAQEEVLDVDTPFFKQVPDCLAPGIVGESLIKKVVTMALKWQSEEPHTDGCNEGFPVWYINNATLYCNGKRAGTVDSDTAQGIVDKLNATEKQGKVYCPTCEALKELEKRDDLPKV